MFAKGMTKPAGSGRKKGTGNHAQTSKRENAAETFSRLAFNPVIEGIRLFRSYKTPLDLKIKIVSELLKYHSPRLSTSAIAHTLEGSVQVEQVQSLMLNADPATVKALEKLSLELSRMELEAHQRQHRDGGVIDTTLALPAASPEPGAEPGAAGDD